MINYERGYTLMEILISIAVLLILVGLGVINYHSVGSKNELNSSGQEIVSILRLAQSKTLGSKKESQYGVYFSTSSDPHRYILFQGPDYVSRATSSDVIYELSEELEFYKINLGGDHQVVFEYLTGNPEQNGEIGLRLKDSSKTKLIKVKESGQLISE